ncbi:hypothetical protein D3C81_2110170 [compost metagenome]
MKGRGMIAASVSFQLINVLIAIKITDKYAVESVSVSMPKPTVWDTDLRSFVARAIKSPVRFRSKNGGVMRSR